MPNKDGSGIEKLASRSKIYLIVIGIILIVLCTYDLRWIIPSILIFGSLILYSIWVNDKKKTEIVNHIQEVTADVNVATKNTLINAPVPLIVIETDGNIVWKSKKFVTQFKGIEINPYLDSIVKEIKLEIENSQEEIEIKKQITIENRIYNIIGNYTRSKKRDKRKQKEYILTLYFIDETEYNELLAKYNDSQICIGLAMVDNQEEITQRILPEEQPIIMAEIDKMIYDWISSIGGLIVKTERDTFVYAFEEKYLKEFEKDKFKILDRVKTIKIDSKIQITLSIAVSNEGKTSYEKYKSALSSMDIVLGRGGDQAIVRKDGKYKFYGGKTLEVEKRTKVKARVISHAMAELIQEAKNVVIMGHKNSDIDSLGSSLGVYRFAKTLNKEAYILNNTTGLTLGKFLNELLKEEEYQKAILTPAEALQKVSPKTLLVVVDTHKTSYVEAPELLERTDKIVIIDHHRKGTDFIENPILSFHEVYASSAAELVTEIIQYSENIVQIPTIEAESLYGGIMVDTKNFTFKTGVRTFEAAAYLRKFGVDIIKVKKWFQSDLESYNLIADVVKRAEIINDNIAISVYDREDKDANLICAKAADELLTISDITASFVLGNMGDKICISGRSIGDINVQIIMEKLGGGGHITLAGAQLEGLTLQEATDELIIRINEYLTEIQE